jgi:hypothetical protein
LCIFDNTLDIIIVTMSSLCHTIISYDKFNINDIQLRDPILLNNGKSRRMVSTKKYYIQIGSQNDIKMVVMNTQNIHLFNQQNNDTISFKIISIDVLEFFNQFDEILRNFRQSIRENYKNAEWLRTRLFNRPINSGDLEIHENKIINWDKDDFIIFKKSKNMKIFIQSNNDIIEISDIPENDCYYAAPIIEFHGMTINNGKFTAIFMVVQILLISKYDESIDRTRLEKKFHELETKAKEFDMLNKQRPKTLVHDIQILSKKISRIIARTLKNQHNWTDLVIIDSSSGSNYSSDDDDV